MATKPTIDIEFKQLATTLITRSERGTAILLLNDSTTEGITTKVYKTVADIDDSLYSDKNLKYIKDCLSYAPYEVVVISAKDGRISDFAPAIMAARSTGWIAAPGTDSALKIISKVYNPGDNINELEVTYDSTDLWANTTGISVEYNGITFDTALKIQKDCEIKFTVPKSDSITLVTYTSSSSGNSQILVDGLAISIGDGASTTTIHVEKGEHTITRGANDAYLFGLYFEYIEDELQDDLAGWVKSMENAGKTYKAIGTVAGKDCMHYVYFDQTTYDSDGDTQTAGEYLASLLGIIASCNIAKGCTNFLCTDLSLVDEVDDIDSAIAAGQLVLTNDIGGVRIVTGINSLVTLNGNTATEDMQYIETVEAMDLIRDDIRTVFKTTYQGNYKNKYKYQLLFIGAVNQYYSQLEAEDVLDDEFDNKADIDVDEQCSAWVGTGKSEAEDWDEDEVKSMAFKRSVFLASNIKILNCMENLKFAVTLE